ncbi:hypothetical protein A0H81_08960 [Grifola frondosa]|uniref:F-box domain-containing protein n=1 Tax=Grifola frondosa TaxID=5627 RepID=A0A1C7M5P2_GRIFR|nr:hypothetical protein A0H81_08960 [Grifola frondosa]
MPLDILFEIFVHLHPRDLLHLSRTSKDFRAILMSRTSAHFWKAARQHVEGLPDCPPFLSEPAYANLLFSPHCHICLKGNVQSIIWPIFARYCKSCKQSCLLQSHIISTMVPKDMTCSIWHTLTVVPDTNRSRHILFSKVQLDEFIALWRAKLRKHAALLEDWNSRRVAARAEELDDVRRQRLEQIVLRLRDEGWGEELDILKANEYHSLSCHALVKQARKVTSRGWPKIRDTLVEYMEELKSRRLKDERLRLLEARCKVLDTAISKYQIPRTAATELMPRFVDFALMPEFRDIVDAPSSTNLTPDDFLPLQDTIPELVSRWQAAIKTELTSMVAERVQAPPNVDVLDLAVAVFDCSRCNRSLHYPESLRTVVSMNPFTICRKLKIGRGFENTQKIVQSCGKDPNSTTRQEMHELDVRLRPKCCNTETIHQVMTFETAMEHRHIHDYNDIVWELLSEDQATKVKELEIQSYSGQIRSMDIIRDHLKRSHGIEDANIANGDMYEHPDGDITTPSVWLISDVLSRNDLSLTMQSVSIIALSSELRLLIL